MLVNTDIYSHWPHPDEEHHHLLRSSALSPLALCPWQRHPPPFRPLLIHSANRLFRDPFLSFFFWKGKRKERKEPSHWGGGSARRSFNVQRAEFVKPDPSVQVTGGETGSPFMETYLPSRPMANVSCIHIHPMCHSSSESYYHNTSSSQPAFQRPNDR